MKTISSQAGTRLAKAHAAVMASHLSETQLIDRYALHIEFEEAARAVADELVAAGFADAEGDDA